MIKNVFFDFGQVLIKFIPYDMTKVYVRNEEDVKLIEQVVFDRLYWDKLDEGKITDEQVMTDVYKRLPERLHQQAREVYFNWIYNIPQIEGMEKIVTELKNKGINICLLSNISWLFINHYKECPILKHFDRFVFSAEIGLAKPNKEIFEYALNKQGFIAEETLFVDDRKENIIAANNVGINGYVFDGDAVKLCEYLKSIELL